MIDLRVEPHRRIELVVGDAFVGHDGQVYHVTQNDENTFASVKLN